MFTERARSSFRLSISLRSPLLSSPSVRPKEVITYYQSHAAVPSALRSSASSVCAAPSSVPAAFLDLSSITAAPPTSCRAPSHLYHTVRSPYQPSYCDLRCTAACRLCRTDSFQPDPISSSSVAAGPTSTAALLSSTPFLFATTAAPFYDPCGAVTAAAGTANLATPLVIPPHPLGLPAELLDDEFHDLRQTAITATVYPAAEIQLLPTNAQHLQPEPNHPLPPPPPAPPYILVAAASHEKAKHSPPEALQLVLLNSNPNSSPQLSNTLSGFGHLLNAVPANLEFIQMVRYDLYSFPHLSHLPVPWSPSHCQWKRDCFIFGICQVFLLIVSLETGYVSSNMLCFRLEIPF